jgi:hypothetical protein
MSNTKVQGKRVVVKQSANVLFAFFSDLTNLVKNIPDDLKTQSELSATSDTLMAKVKGFSIGLKVEERILYKSVKYIQNGNSPFPFAILVNMNSIGEAETDFQLEMEAELPMMIKMMIGGKLQEFVDKITDEIERGFGGIV